MEEFKKEIPAERIDAFCTKEFGKLPVGNILPSEVFHNSSAPIEERFMEIAKTCYLSELSRNKAGTMVCRFEMYL